MDRLPVVVPGDVTVVAEVTGESSPNRTMSRFGFLATDLGVLWDDGAGAVLVAFGDTYGAGWRPPGAGSRSADHRRNVLARSRATTPAELAGGLPLDSVVEDAPGHAAEILGPTPGQRHESTVIPTAGLAVGGRQYLHYMSVRSWGPPGRWVTNHAGIARSDDGGSTWTPAPGARWRNSWTWFGRHPFQLGAFTRDERWVYLFGTPNGRFGDVHLARVEPSRVDDVAGYRYWTGGGWGASVRAAAPVAAGPAGELSVAYHRGLRCWLMVHLDEARAEVVLRAAPDVVGPWSAPTTLVSGREHPGLYGCYLHPGALGGDEIYFTMSRWGPYNVFLVRAGVKLS